MSYLDCSKSRLYFVLMMVMAAVALAACTSSSPTPTPTPTATPTPTPTPVPITPVRIDPEEDPAGFLNALPAAEVECAAQAAGGREKLMEVVSKKTSPAQELALAIGNCLSHDTVVRIVTGQIEIEAGALSEKTLLCISERSQSINIQAMIAGGELDPAAMVGMLQAVFCLDKNERAALQASSEEFMFGGAGIDELECFVNAVGPAKLGDAFKALMSMGDSGQFSPEVIQAMSLFLPAALKCGVVPEEDLAGSGLTGEQMACLFENGGDTFAQFMETASTGVQPDLAQLAKLLDTMSKCGVDLEQLTGGTPPAPAGTPGPLPTIAPAPTQSAGLPQVTLTAEQTNCLASKVGPDVLSSLQSGNLDPAKVLPLLGALSQCNIDVAALFATPAPK